MKIYIDGKYYEEKNARISVSIMACCTAMESSRAFRAYNGRVFRLKEHIDRLFCSAKAILLKIPCRTRL